MDKSNTPTRMDLVRECEKKIEECYCYLQDRGVTATSLEKHKVLITSQENKIARLYLEIGITKENILG